MFGLVMQAALGELAYSSEAAERLRAELRASAAKLRSAQDDIAATKRELQEGAAARQTIEAELTALKQEQQKQSDFAARLSVYALSLTILPSDNAGVMSCPCRSHDV